MAHEVTIPKLGLTMTEGTLAEWLKPSGTEVRNGEPIYTLVTDKLETEIEAEADGVLHHVAAPGTTAACGTVVGWVAQPGEEVAATDAAGSAPTAAEANVVSEAPHGNGRASVPTAGRLLASPNARRLAADLGVDLERLRGSGPDGAVLAVDVTRAGAAPAPPAPAEPQPVVTALAASPGGDGTVRWTPVARRLAARLGLDGAGVAGTGPGGRITLDDVIAASGVAVHAPPAAAPGRPTLAPGLVPITGRRKIIAERMHASLRDTAQLTIGAEAEVDELLDLRARLKTSWGSAGIPVPTLTDVLVKAVALALLEHPRVNAAVVGDAIELLADVHVGIAVDVDDGLIVPVVRHADLLSLDELAAETARLGASAREGRLTLDEMSGATFTISNLGTAGVDFFTPILNSPNVAILGVGRVKQGNPRPDGSPRRVMTLSLTIDHRALDGAPAARFLGTVRQVVEAPHRLLASS